MTNDNEIHNLSTALWWRTALAGEVEVMKQAQRESWVRAMAPCEHGEPDWETCLQCRVNGRTSVMVNLTGSAR